MSYSEFLDDLNDFYKDLHERGVVEPVSLEKAQNIVRDKWLVAGRHRELISFILENWDSGNCDDFIKPLIEVLLKNNDSKSYKRLWRGVLRHRIETTRSYLSYLKADIPALTVKELDAIDLSDFSEFSSKETLLRRTAFLRRATLDGITEYIGGLELLQQDESEDESEIEWAKDLFERVLLMQKPRLKPATDKRKIDKEVFWQLIEQSRSNDSDQFEFLENLKVSLESFRPNEIRSFQKILLKAIEELYSWEHWALAYIVRRGCGDDEFDYFRAWAVSKGRESFEAVKRLDPEFLKNIFSEDPQLEPLLYLAERIYEESTGEIMKEIRSRKPKLTGKEWGEDSLIIEFPNLCQLFNYPG